MSMYMKPLQATMRIWKMIVLCIIKKFFFLATHPVVNFIAPVLASLFDPLLQKPQRTVEGGYA